MRTDIPIGDLLRGKQRVRVWKRKKLDLRPLTVQQREMFQLGQAGVGAVKRRVTAAIGPEDQKAKPLKPWYARFKSRKGKSNVRDLTFTGGMLRNLLVRTVSERDVRAGLSSRKDRAKAAGNQRKEEWLVFSPRNKQEIADAAKRIAERRLQEIVKQ